MVNITNGSPPLLERLLTAGLLKKITRFIYTPDQNRNSTFALIVLQNIIRYKKVLHEVCRQDLLAAVVGIASQEYFRSARTQACIALATAAAMKDADVTKYLLDLGAAPALIEYIDVALGNNDYKTALKLLNGIWDLLESGDTFNKAKSKSGHPDVRNPFVFRILEDGKLLNVLFDQYMKQAGKKNLEDIEIVGEVEDEDVSSDSSVEDAAAKKRKAGKAGGGDGVGGAEEKENDAAAAVVNPRQQVVDRIKGLTNRWFRPQIETAKAKISEELAAQYGLQLDQLAEGLDEMAGFN
ncbi:hypothetical protein HDV00_006869 [Rhizophlyctis rosea]|nr:hypothetical protein HDV00_006869 [Rhizophlyctis rosea]